MVAPAFFHRIRLPDGSYTPGTVNYGPDGGDWPTTRFGMPTNLNGKKVIDIGCYDGFFAFEAEQRGGSVLATDWIDQPGFNYARHKINSQIPFIRAELDELPKLLMSPTFDVVLFYGVLYHLKSPLTAMESICALTKPGGLCLLETALAELTYNHPVLEYRPGHENDPYNFFYPNEKWIFQSAKEVGFKRVQQLYLHPDRTRATFMLSK